MPSYRHFEQSVRITLPWLERALAALGPSLAVVPAGEVALPEPVMMRARQRSLQRVRPGIPPTATPPPHVKLPPLPDPPRQPEPSPSRD